MSQNTDVETGPVRIGIEFTPENLERLDKAASVTGKSVEQYLNSLIEFCFTNARSIYRQWKGNLATHGLAATSTGEDEEVPS